MYTWKYCYNVIILLFHMYTYFMQYVFNYCILSIMSKYIDNGRYFIWPWTERLIHSVTTNVLSCRGFYTMTRYPFCDCTIF